ncbi:MAG: hypothetical protein OMM_10993 [Candidatus Magnetoglobus multicellularis str. Araruama]|uniref:DUF4145 domain-containing protein n=1 Tax=Candidatus Magnetoglobus multicellularis str. Araruama TaxID=890399 RepID=A0A1V1NZI6_9BACT|nr:MAG: hypothetical protein OMM_10993 [Candidatus Magnetoglobus multicellularis str. Araruama]
MKKDCSIRSQVAYEFDHFSEIDDEMEAIKDLFIIDAFAAFERLLRKRVLDSLESQKNELSANLVQVVRNESEFIKIETLLDVLKNFVDSNRIGLIKQIKRYRDWVAHGKRPLTYSPVKPVDIYVIFEAIRLVAVTVTGNNE